MPERNCFVLQQVGDLGKPRAIVFTDNAEGAVNHYAATGAWIPGVISVTLADATKDEDVFVLDTKRTAYFVIERGIVKRTHL